MEEIIQARHVYKIFGDDPEKGLKALRRGESKDEILARHGQIVGVQDASFSVRRGETFVIMGLSGSGKSTLQRLINLLHRPTSGEIRIDGTRIDRLGSKELREFRRRYFCGMVFQNFAILPHRTVLGNVAFGLELQGMATEARLKKAREVIELVGLQGNEESYPSQLSGGMQQRVGLARGLAIDADILLMDEAFSALDPLIRRQMQDELIDLQSRMKKTILFVTHDLDEAFRIGDRIAIMKDGCIVQVGTAEEIISSPANDYVRAFVEDMDRAAVITSGAIMQQVKETAFVSDGPRTIMRKMRKNGLSGMFMVDASYHLKGYVEADELAKHISRHKDESNIPWDAALLHEATSVKGDVPLSEVIGLYQDAKYGPVAVTDEQNRLKGVIVRGAILAALAENGNGSSRSDTDTRTHPPDSASRSERTHPPDSVSRSERTRPPDSASRSGTTHPPEA